MAALCIECRRNKTFERRAKRWLQRLCSCVRRDRVPSRGGCCHPTAGDTTADAVDIGNSGAHDVEAPLTREDADDAIAFFEALVNYLYTFQRRYNRYKRRKAEESERGEPG